VALAGLDIDIAAFGVESDDPPTVQELGMTQTDEKLDQNTANTKRPDSLATQDPNTTEHLFIWEDVRQAAAQPRK
jgi:hypothetical protein